MKKKCTVFLLLLVLVFTSPVRSLSFGTELGSVFYSDIKAYVKGSPVRTYNVDDKLLIDCDSLSDYGFYVFWLGDARQLSIIDSGGLPSNDDAFWVASSGIPGEFAGKYYESDIQVFLNGGKIRSWSMGDRLLISLDDMKNYGYSVVWDGQQRSLSVSVNHKILVTDIGNVKTNFFEKEYWSETYSHKGALTIDGLELQTANSNYLTTGIQNTAFVPLQDTLKALGLWYEYDPLSCEFKIYSPTSPVSYRTVSRRTGISPQRVDEYYFTKVPIKILVDNVHTELLSGYHILPRTGETVRLSVSPVLYKGVVYVPANLFADILGYSCNDGLNLITK